IESGGRSNPMFATLVPRRAFKAVLASVGLRRGPAHVQTRARYEMLTRIVPWMRLWRLSMLAAVMIAAPPAPAQLQHKPSILVITGDDIGLPDMREQIPTQLIAGPGGRSCR